MSSRHSRQYPAALQYGSGAEHPRSSWQSTHTPTETLHAGAAAGQSVSALHVVSTEPPSGLPPPPESLVTRASGPTDASIVAPPASSPQPAAPARIAANKMRAAVVLITCRMPAARTSAQARALTTAVTALDRSTGSQLWSYDLGCAPRRVHADDERVYVLDSRGTIHSLLSANGRLLGKFELRMRNANALLWDGERLFVTDEDEVVALDLAGGVLWRTSVATNGAWGLGGLAVGARVVPPDFSRG